MCDHSNKSYLAVLSCGAVYYAVQGGSKGYNNVILIVINKARNTDFVTSPLPRSRTIVC